jgi:hypothetical protein
VYLPNCFEMAENSRRGAMSCGFLRSAALNAEEIRNHS